MPAEVKDPKILQINYNYKPSADEYVEVSNVSIKTFDATKELSMVTRAP